MWAHFWRMIRTHESAEIVHHGLIGAVVAMILVLVEVLQHRFFDEHHWAVALLAIPAAGLIAFLVLAAATYFVRLKIPVKIEGVEDIVDGTWIYRTRDVGGDRWTRASITKIKSSGWDFDFDGESYYLADSAGSPGHFRANGYPWDDDKISFRYKGFDQGGKSGRSSHDLGVGYYQFYREGTELCIRGAFTGYLGPEQELRSRELEGRRISSKILPLTNLEKQRLLEDVKSKALDSGFSGIWVDAIYERQNGDPGGARGDAAWKLIQGSIVEIAPSESDSKSFTVKGSTFDEDALLDGRIEAVHQGFEFKGEGRLFAKPSFSVLYFVFAGHEGSTGEGVGRYEMRHDGQSFVGEFTRGQTNSMRIVFGKRIQERNFARQVKELKEHLGACLNNPPANLSREGR